MSLDYVSFNVSYLTSSRNAMDQDIPSTTLETSLRPSSSNESFTATPTSTSQPLRRSPRTKSTPLLKSWKQHQPATTDVTAGGLQPTQPRESAKEPKKKPAMHVHRMLRVEIPEDATGVQVGQCIPLIIFIAQGSEISRTPSNYMYDCFGD